MLPSILPRSVLHVDLVACDSIRPGDVVSFPGSDGAMVAHRVVRAPDGEGSTTILVKGDGQAQAELLPVEAVAYIVTRVEHPLWSYDVTGPTGRTLAWVAIHHAWVTVGAARMLGRLLALRTAARALVAFRI
jgi:hypothetical protein